jgi:hypothetical protein
MSRPASLRERRLEQDERLSQPVLRDKADPLGVQRVDEHAVERERLRDPERLFDDRCSACGVAAQSQRPRELGERCGELGCSLATLKRQLHRAVEAGNGLVEPSFNYVDIRQPGARARREALLPCVPIRRDRPLQV